jgi:hypothetical protein
MALPLLDRRWINAYEIEHDIERKTDLSSSETRCPGQWQAEPRNDVLHRRSSAPRLNLEESDMATIEPMVQAHLSLGEAICARLIAEIYELGFLPEQIAMKPVYSEASFETSRDPFSGTDTLCAYWRSPKGHRVGEMKFHADGTFFAEYDVVLPHPKDPRWFVEGVVAWGRGDVIKSEAKLLPALGE